jgi:hypothetical protein
MKVSLNCEKELREFQIKTNRKFINFIEEIKHAFYIQYLLVENRAVYEILWKRNRRDGQVTDDNMAHAHCVLDT